MTIRKGEPWGEPAVCPTDLRIVSTDRDLREWVVWHRQRDQPIRALGVAGGDLATNMRRRRGRPSECRQGDRRRDAGRSSTTATRRGASPMSSPADTGCTATW